jgi:beta-glucosidase
VSASLVLLKNEQKTLPLASNAQRIFVAGSAANNTGIQSGGWTIEWQGVDGNVIPGATSILEGIQQLSKGDMTISYDERGNFPENTPLADVGIAIIGEKPYAEGVGDNANPTISPEDLAAIASLRAVSKKLVVIIVSGRPLLLPDDAIQWDTIIAAWLPGSEGGGVADALFGKTPFTGKLPIPWPKDLKQLPFSPDDIAADKNTPLFSVGFGLQ